MVKTALVYDFDKTLCTKDMQEYSLIPNLGYENPADFWKEVTELKNENRMDSISAYLYLLQKKYADNNEPLRKEMFVQAGKTIELFPGVDTWFDRVNAYGKSLGLDIEHYIISSGMKEIIENAAPASSFKHIYACSYLYDENGYACWPSMIVNYTTKTQYIFRINKGFLDEEKDEELNKYTPRSKRAIPFTRMIYIADGLTDVPCMKLVREYGGKSIAVYTPGSKTGKSTAEQLIEEQRADFMSETDYRKNSDMENLVFRILDHMKADAVLEGLEGFR